VVLAQLVAVRHNLLAVLAKIVAVRHELLAYHVIFKTFFYQTAKKNVNNFSEQLIGVQGARLQQEMRDR
jgi:hypothetical protein